MRLRGKTAIVTGSTKGIGRDDASFITGEVLTADGGWSAYGYL
jgi:NAD(P)-dependent dehydrogenase (short-subunit alcohol dehydrogenase family)